MAVREFPMTNWPQSMWEVIKLPAGTLIGSAGLGITKRYMHEWVKPEKIQWTAKQSPDHWTVNQPMTAETE